MLIETLNKFGLDGIKKKFGVKSRMSEIDNDLFVLNYDQTDSFDQKTHQIVKECRSLVVRRTDDTWMIESRSFDRFFNYQEDGCEEIKDIKDYKVQEKVDGSLLSVWWSEKFNKFLYRTRSLINPHEEMKTQTGRSWKNLIDSVLGPVIPALDRKDCTYIFEIVSEDNRIVTKYDAECCYILGIRINLTGEYIDTSSVKFPPEVRYPKQFKCSDLVECSRLVNTLDNLQEGFVLSLDGRPVMKMKSKEYIEAHRMRGEGVLTKKNIIEILLQNEQDEYLAVFPEHKEKFDAVSSKWKETIDELNRIWEEVKNETDKKEYSKKVKGCNVKLQKFLYHKKKDESVRFDEMIRNTNVNKLVELFE